MVHWNINPDGGNVCGGAYNALCIQRKPLSLQQCMVAVHRAGYAAGHHSLAANVDGTGEWTAGSCWGKYEGVLDGPLFHEVSQGAPDLSVSKEECQEYATSIDRPFIHEPTYFHFALGCTRYFEGSAHDIYWSENPAASEKSCGQGWHRCIQRVAYYVEREVASFNVRTITNELGGYASMLQEKTSGQPSAFSEAECRAFSVAIGADFGSNSMNPGPGCVVTADRNHVRYNPGACQHASLCDCSASNICIGKHEHAHISDETLCRHIPSFDSVIFDIEESAGCILRDGKAYFNTYMANGPFYIYVNGGFEQVASEALRPKLFAASAQSMLMSAKPSSFNSTWVCSKSMHCCGFRLQVRSTCTYSPIKAVAFWMHL